ISLSLTTDGLLRTVDKPASMSRSAQKREQVGKNVPVRPAGSSRVLRSVERFTDNERDFRSSRMLPVFSTGKICVDNEKAVRSSPQSPERCFGWATGRSFSDRKRSARSFG